MSRPSVYIPIEVKNREFVSQVVLAAVAAQKGFRIYLGTHQSTRLAINAKTRKGGLYFDKGGLNSFWLAIKNKCDYLAVLDQELSPALIDENYLEKAVQGRFLAGNENIVDYSFVVGPAIEKASAAILPSTCNLIQSGWPRVDLWSKTYASIFEGAAEQIRSRHGEFLLFSSDFGVTSRKQLNAKIGLRNDMSAEIHEREYFDEIQTHNTFEDFTIAVGEIRKWDAVPSIPQIIVRPHPADDHGAWKKELKNLKKTKVIYDGDIGAWIEASEGLIHRGCTTAIQASFLGKPTFFLLSAGTRNVNSLPYLVSDYLLKAEDKPTVSSQKNPSISSRDQILKTYIHLPPNGACEEIVKHWIDMNLTSEPTLRKARYLRECLKPRNIRRNLGVVKWEIRWIVGATPYEPPSQALKGGIRKSSVLGILDNLPFKHAVEVKKIGRNLLVIESKESAI